MTSNPLLARDDVYNRFVSCVTANSGGIFTGVKVTFWNTEGDPPVGAYPNGNPEKWIRAAVKHDPKSKNVSMRGPDGSALQTSKGAAIFQIREAVNNGNVWTDQVAVAIMNAYANKSSPSGVIFRASALKEIGPDGIYFRTDLLVPFQYDMVVQ